MSDESRRERRPPLACMRAFNQSINQSINSIHDNTYVTKVEASLRPLSAASRRTTQTAAASAVQGVPCLPKGVPRHVAIAKIAARHAMELRPSAAPGEEGGGGEKILSTSPHSFSAKSDTAKAPSSLGRDRHHTANDVAAEAHQTASENLRRGPGASFRAAYALKSE